MIRFALVVSLALLCAGGAQAADDRFAETRYCGAPLRTEDGRIARSRGVLAAFKRRYPCPTTGSTTGACPGWAIDHVIPLACGGCDAVRNLQWLRDEIKSCSGAACKDRWERAVYETEILCK